ncbi:MAG: putative capsular polysaccharide synthesis family protein [Clostridia bacterium]
MITIPRLTENDMDKFRGKKVILVGNGINRCIVLHKIFSEFNIKISGCYLEENYKTITIKSKFNLIKNFKLKKIMKPYIQLEYDLKNQENTIVIITSVFEESITKCKTIVEKCGVEVSDITIGEILNSFSYLALFKCVNNFYNNIYLKVKCIFNEIQDTKFLEKYYKYKDNTDTPIFICSPTKTGDFTLINTFDIVNSRDVNQYKINHLNVWHVSKKININFIKKTNYKIKILVGLRDPISQNLSDFYQKISETGVDETWISGEIMEKSNIKKREIFEKYRILLSEKNINIQILWNLYVLRYVYSLKTIDARLQRSIQFFVHKFQENILDITKYPFNKEEGYTIIKEENIEIFVYQLEKLNNLVPELSKWVDVPFTELVRGNETSDKWIADSYRQAQKEIEITQEYFDKCYNEPYVQHCYSQEDIEKFKERWRMHIK